MMTCRRIITILQVYVDALSYKYILENVFFPPSATRLEETSTFSLQIFVDSL